MKKPDLPYLQKKKGRNGKIYWYFSRGKDERVPLPDPSDDAFMQAYTDARKGRVRVPVKRNFDRLIEEYLKSPKWQKLAPRTKKDYRKAIEYIREVAGHADPAKMIRRDVIEAQLANTHRKRFANEIPAMLSRLFEYGINIGWLTYNPARGVEKLETGDGYQPWPEPLIDRFRAACDPDTRLVFELCLNTGQRIADVLKMRWSDIEDNGINVVQNKTGTELWIPFTDDMATYLSGVPKKGIFICTNPLGRQLSYNTAEDRFRRVRKAVNGKGYTLHGLRYTAATRLANAGCTDAQIASITGHKSAEMVAKYSRKSNQRGLAGQAVSRLK